MAPTPKKRSSNGLHAAPWSEQNHAPMTGQKDSGDIIPDTPVGEGASASQKDDQVSSKPNDRDDEKEQDQDVLEIQVLDSETAALLGEIPNDGAKRGPKIHNEVATRWNAIAKSGLPKEERTSFQELTLPENLDVFTPVLNPELITAIPDIAKSRDDSLRRVQEHVASVLGSLGRILSDQLTNDSVNRPSLISELSTAGRYLAGTQYSLSLMRRRSIQSQIKDSAITKVLQNATMYPNLFGSDLSSEVKTAKAVSKVGHEITSIPTKSTEKPGYRRHEKPVPKAPEQPLNFHRPLPSHPPARHYGNRSGQTRRSQRRK